MRCSKEELMLESPNTQQVQNYAEFADTQGVQWPGLCVWAWTP